MKRLTMLSAAAALSAIIATPALAQGVLPDTGGLYNMQDPSTLGGQPDSRPYSGGSIGHTAIYPSAAADAYAYDYGYEPGQPVYRPGVYSYAGQPAYRTGFLPADIAAEAIGGAAMIAGTAVNTAGAIATAPFRAGMAGESTARGAYASVEDNTCAQRFRSYDPASGTYLGYDGKRHACR